MKIVDFDVDELLTERIYFYIVFNNSKQGTGRREFWKKFSTDERQSDEEDAAAAKQNVEAWRYITPLSLQCTLDDRMPSS